MPFAFFFFCHLPAPFFSVISQHLLFFPSSPSHGASSSDISSSDRLPWAPALPIIMAVGWPASHRDVELGSSSTASTFSKIGALDGTHIRVSLSTGWASEVYWEDRDTHPKCFSSLWFRHAIHMCQRANRVLCTTQVCYIMHWVRTINSFHILPKVKIMSIINLLPLTIKLCSYYFLYHL